MSAPELVAEAPLHGAPPKPTGFDARCGFEVCMLSWDHATSRYDNHKSTWVYRSRINDDASAERVGTAPWILYTDDNLRSNTTYYYWIRWESTNGVLGPFSDVASDTTAIRF
jgi:predicted phage tail protein